MTKTKQDPIAALVDEIGDIEFELAPFKKHEARLTLLRAELRTHYDGLGADATFEAHGTRYVTMIGAAGWTNAVNVVRLFKAIGPKEFLSVAAVTLKAFATLKRTDLEVVESAQNGARTLKTLPKGVAA